jgi:hypothetical protein
LNVHGNYTFVTTLQTAILSICYICNGKGFDKMICNNLKIIKTERGLKKGKVKNPTPQKVLAGHVNSRCYII